MVVIVHSLAVSVEQLCARSQDAPSIDDLRPKFCAICGASCRDADGVLRIVGHGMYSRQVRGLSESTGLSSGCGFICLACGHTLSRLPDASSLALVCRDCHYRALYRHCMLRQSAREIGVRFSRPEDESRWRSLDRWRVQLLVSPTLWGWLGPRLAITTLLPAEKKLVHMFSGCWPKVWTGFDRVSTCFVNCLRLYGRL